MLVSNPYSRNSAKDALLMLKRRFSNRNLLSYRINLSITKKKRRSTENFMRSSIVG